MYVRCQREPTSVSKVVRSCSPAPLFIIETILAFGSPVAIQIYRYKRVSTAAQRQQTRWVIFSLVCFVLLLVFPEPPPGDKAQLVIYTLPVQLTSLRGDPKRVLACLS